MATNAGTLPAECPDCGGEVITACRRCGAGIASLMALTCAECGAELRPAQLFGVDIRRKPERHHRVDARRRAHDNESTAL
jgi:predicted amidophosphoribosyltransferase